MAENRNPQPSSYVQSSPGNGYKHSRVTSTVAQSFAADLDSMFGLSTGGPSGGLETLSQTVEEKKEKVSSGQTELEQLEARLRETEQRLARVSRNSSPSRPGAGRTVSGNATGVAQPQEHPFAQRPTYPDDRPPTGASRPQAAREDTQQLMQGMPGAMPQTPTGQANGRDDYVMVDKGSSGR
ncbi:hypothetical protein LTR09_001928 [Extremus antarcticus]|uniref:Uncharacterized protein n=1 Tax=Extremus antarcticus TaxID=702011 RepID=A0AAJ0GG40_9PEZI|nr:hypothetical protein LTR09_001928 [Extremus antarcticus]